MARTVALSQLRTDARLFADQRVDGSGGFISNTELNRLINLQLAELYDLLVAARGADYYASSSTQALAAGTASYALPATFYQMLSVTLEWASTDHEIVEPADSITDRAAFINDVTWERFGPKAYSVRGANIEFLPTPTSAVTCRYQFIPAFADLVADGDTFDGVNGWDKLATLGAAIDMRTIRKDPTADLVRMYDAQRQRIEALAAERLVESPKRVLDRDPMRRPWWRSHGKAYA